MLARDLVAARAEAAAIGVLSSAASDGDGDASSTTPSAEGDTITVYLAKVAAAPPTVFRGVRSMLPRQRRRFMLSFLGVDGV